MQEGCWRIRVTRFREQIADGRLRYCTETTTLGFDGTDRARRVPVSRVGQHGAQAPSTH